MRARNEEEGRFVSFFGGKGGVGKTTCSASYALSLAGTGVKTLLVSTDPAHSLSDLFGMKFSGKPKKYNGNLAIQEIDNDTAAKRYFTTIKQQLKKVASPELWQEVERQIDLASLSPGAAEAALFDEVAKLILDSESEYDHIVFDTAPTGHTLRLLTLPELMNSWIEIMVKRRESFQKKNQLLENIAGTKEHKTDLIYQSLQKRKNQFAKLREKLFNHKLCKFYFVLNPEKLAILETGKALKQLERDNIAIGGLIINRVLPDVADGEFLSERRMQEALYLRDIAERFRAYKHVQIPMFTRDVTSVDGLYVISEQLENAFHEGG